MLIRRARVLIMACTLTSLLIELVFGHGLRVEILDTFGRTILPPTIGRPRFHATYARYLFQVQRPRHGYLRLC
jgi:hypothetical protein